MNTAVDSVLGSDCCFFDWIPSLYGFRIHVILTPLQIHGIILAIHCYILSHYVPKNAHALCYNKNNTR